MSTPEEKFLRDMAAASEPDHERVAYIAVLAEQQCAVEGEVEFDAITADDISEGDDNGAYVRAWVWVSFSGTKLDKDDEDSLEEMAEAETEDEDE